MKIKQIEGLAIALEQAGLNWNKTPLVDNDSTYVGSGLRFIITKNQTGDCIWYHNGNTGIASFNDFPYSVIAPAQDATNPYNILFAYNTSENSVKMYYSAPAAIPDTLSIDSGYEILIAQFQIPAVGSFVVVPTEPEKPTQGEIQYAIDATDYNTIENIKRATCKSLRYLWDYIKTKIVSQLLTGFSVAVTYSSIAATDSILSAFGKVQKRLNEMKPIWNDFFSSITATPNSTSAIDRLNSGIDFTTFLKLGYGVKWKTSGVYYFGMITSLSASQFSINGVAFVTGSASITEIYYCNQQNISRFDIEISNSDIRVVANLLVDGYTAHPIKAPSGYLVKYDVWSKIVDSGATKAKLNIKNGSNSITSVTDGIEFTTAKTYNTSAVTIQSAYYYFNYGDNVVFTISQPGSNLDTQDSKVEMYFILES